MLIYKQADSDIELRQILKLQQANLPKNITTEDKVTQGFLTVEHSFELLKQMNEVCKHTIALAENQIVGYALSMHPSFGDKIPVLKPMLVEIKKVVPLDCNYIIMGQVCIAKNYRGKGIFRGLYKAMKKFLPTNVDKIITEVDTKNIRSITAHHSVGFRELKRYVADEKEWSLIVL
jgi:GNAT superfamily N-acetyltransferase